MSLSLALFDRREDVGHHLCARLRALRALPVDPDAHGSGFEVAMAEDEHRVRLHLFGAGDLGFDRVVAGVERGADAVGAQFGLNALRVVHQVHLVPDRQRLLLPVCEQSFK